MKSGTGVVFIAVVMSLLLTACGGGDDSPEEGGAGDTTTTTPSDTTTAVASTSTTAAVASASPTTTDNVRREWTNAAVSVWQQFLAERGAVIDVDGFFGGQTEAATLAFQREMGIPETGVADRLTLNTAGVALRDAVFAEMTVITTTTTIVRDPQPGDPTITISCPPTETETQTRYRAVFDHTESYRSFGNINIEYGDGKDFGSRLEDSGLTGAFWHVYEKPGTYEVTVSITDGDGIQASASCTLTWKPA